MKFVTLMVGRLGKLLRSCVGLQTLIINLSLGYLGAVLTFNRRRTMIVEGAERWLIISVGLFKEIHFGEYAYSLFDKS